ncbi:MAG: Uma2 family endonuclease [Byssovorax sp.]
MASAPTALRRKYDPTVYPSEDFMGEGSLQRFITELLREQIERWLHQQKKHWFVGANQFIYWKQFDPSSKLAPDVFFLPGVKPGIKIDSWKTWETGVIPPLAIEVVSQDYLKDYSDAPGSYDALGVKELIIFDPDFETQRSERMRFQVYRRVGKRGLVRVEATNAKHVKSRVLGCSLRSVGADPEMVRLRLATGPEADQIFPTDAEAEHAALEAERAARVEAEVEIARLRTELKRLRKP